MRVHDLITFVQRNYASLQGIPNLQDRPLDYVGRPSPDQLDVPQEQGERPPVPNWLEEADDEVLVNVAGGELVALEGQANSSETKTPTLYAQETIDTLAYYLPFHFYQRRWGIYLKASGIVHLAVALKAAPLTSADNSLVELSRKILFEHEFFHFATEIACSRAEVVAKKSLYDAYFLHSYAPPHEEALANAHAYQKALTRQVSALKSAVAAWMRSQPKGYRDFHQWIARKRFEHGCRRAANYMLQPVSAHSPSHLAEPAEFLFSMPRRSSVPTRILLDLSSIRILKPFRKFDGMRVVVHTNDHPPPHFHIERPPGTDVTRYLWPDLKPYPGDKELSGSEEKNLRSYVDRFGRKIGQKICTVYRQTL
jgi:hypothetical protein